MKNVFFTALLSFVFATTSWADCANRVVLNDSDWAGHIFITLDLGCGQNVPTPKKGDPVTLASDKQQISGTVVAIASVPNQLLRLDVTAGGPAAEGDGSLEQFNASTATITYGGTTLTADVRNREVPQNVNRLKWSIGPASASSSNTGSTDGSGTGTSTAPVSTTVMRLQVQAEYARNGFFGQQTKTLPFRTHASLSIDTTNSPDPKFIDNNVVTLGLESERANFAAIKQVHFGIEGRLSKAANQNVHDGGVVATFSAWLPEIPSVTILSSGPAFIAPPLAIALSYGYADKQTTDATYHGRSGDATATYLLYAYDKYELETSEKWTLNDLSNRPTTVPRTQRLFKVQISYLENPATGFKIAASYENGSVGPVLTKVKQYFVGIALSKFSFSGGSK
ncbi:MAG TPA: hypothetical protein VHY33_14150 [Thermoanaerobaculia bacterium]|jgi:hypothetical protein|nr:hypothetical protein [Thermoanaerobaculia bacterium]